MLDAELGGEVDEGLHARYKRLAALEAEALHALVLERQVLLEARRPRQAVEDVDPLLLRPPRQKKKKTVDVYCVEQLYRKEERKRRIM